ncbi:hypothetical protein FA09DRAFT_151607 [Tilletiopsis washingtonensis]|uniref:Uncharacterized protein n=1 Tax=Tilletiopsis washingtonensis TaxID=58919 RepID=A0A316Z0T5_9BASI|nr:hypothetical protein FA09DRAFT_151607 [Tilletiopsis washingtonensis]PWN95139.1 hypothetical protein FA09DRAFT_151607 [Tilletiopsis washingtonensis]
MRPMVPPSAQPAGLLQPETANGPSTHLGHNAHAEHALQQAQCNAHALRLALSLADQQNGPKQHHIAGGRACLCRACGCEQRLLVGPQRRQGSIGGGTHVGLLALRLGGELRQLGEQELRHAADVRPASDLDAQAWLPARRAARDRGRQPRLTPRRATSKCNQLELGGRSAARASERSKQMPMAVDVPHRSR